MGIFTKGKKESEVNEKKNELNVENESSAKKSGLNAAKGKAINAFTSAVDKEKALSKKLSFWSMVYEVVMMLAYTVMTIVSVFVKWSEASNPFLMAFLLALYVGSFVVMTAYTIKSMRSEEMSYDAKKNTVKNYKSISVIIKKVMKVISVGISILLAIEAWDSGSAFRVISIILIISSVLAFFKALSGIFKEVKKMKKRTEPKKESKIITAKHKIENFSDELKTKNKD